MKLYGIVSQLCFVALRRSLLLVCEDRGKSNDYFIEWEVK